MPNRILRDWTDSERVNALSANAERFFVRLIMKADDYGGFYGDPRLLKAYLFPLLDVRVPDISRWIAECEKAGLVASYEADGKRYLEIRNYGQRLKNSRRRFPPMADTSGNFRELPGTSGNFPSETETRIGDENREKDSSCIFPLTPVADEVRAADAGGVKKQQKPEKIFFDYEGDCRIHGIAPEQIELWREQFPALDIEAELKAASAWLNGNRSNRKKDIFRFLTNWLIRDQDKAPTVSAVTPRYGRQPLDVAATEARADRLAEELRRIGE